MLSLGNLRAAQPSAHTQTQTDRQRDNRQFVPSLISRIHNQPFVYRIIV